MLVVSSWPKMRMAAVLVPEHPDVSKIVVAFVTEATVVWAHSSVLFFITNAILPTSADVKAAVALVTVVVPFVTASAT